MVSAPTKPTVYIYHADETVDMVERPDALSAEPVCKGLTISFEYVWDLESARNLDADPE